jgi:hypothetical protein
VALYLECGREMTVVDFSSNGQASRCVSRLNIMFLPLMKTIDSPSDDSISLPSSLDLAGVVLVGGSVVFGGHGRRTRRSGIGHLTIGLGRLARKGEDGMMRQYLTERREKSGREEEAYVEQLLSAGLGERGESVTEQGPKMRQARSVCVKMR